MRSWRRQMEHRFAQRRLSDYVDGELSAGERRRVARHAAECPDCGPLLRGLTQVRNVLRSIGRSRDDHRSIVPLVLERMRREEGAIGAGMDPDETP